MNTLNARPKLLKQANLTLIRRVIKTSGTATRAEIAAQTGISSTTVRALLTEMLQNKEIESIGYDESSGGRKAERYGFMPNRFCCAAICMADDQMHGLLVNACGDILESTALETAGMDLETTISSYLDKLMKTNEIRAIGLGVPGVVEGNGYLTKELSDGGLHRTNIGEFILQKYGIPVVMENNLNAIAIGFGRCYEKEFPKEKPEDTNMAYIHFNKCCISAGFIVGGQIIHGSHNFAGELGLVMAGENKLLDEQMMEPQEEKQYINTMIQIISWVCGVLNPQYVALGGPALRKDCIGPIGDGLSALLPDKMAAELLYSPDPWQDFHYGMAYLTAGKLFEDIQFIRE